MSRVIWNPRATDTKTIIEWEFVDTYAADDVFKAKIGGDDGSSLSLTLKGSPTPEIVRDALFNAWNGLDATAQGEIRSGNGKNHGEFVEIDCRKDPNDATKLIFTGPLGVPIELDKDVSGVVGNGDVTETTPQTATGKNFADNAMNWSGEALPGNNDTVVFRDNKISCLYNIFNLPVAFTRTGIIVEHYNSFTGNISIPYINPGPNGLSYKEYRIRGCRAEGGSTIGIGDGPGSQYILIECNQVDGIHEIQSSKAVGRNLNDPAVNISNLGSTVAGDMKILVRSAHVGIEMDPDWEPTSAPAIVIIKKDARVLVGRTVDINSIENACDHCCVLGTLKNYTQRQGKLIFDGTEVSLDTAWNVTGGIFEFNGVKFTGNLLFRGPIVIDLSNNPNLALTDTTGEWQLYGNVVIKDPRGLIAASPLTLKHIGRTSYNGFDLGRAEYTVDFT